MRAIAVGAEERSAAMAVFGVAIGLSALLLFLVQPIVAKQVLPWFGGGSGVWTTCLVFFQSVLLAGYAYAHWLSSRLRPQTQWALHTALLSASLLFLPIIVSDRYRPTGGQDAAVHILVLLTATIGLPYFVLAATGPLLQSWLARESPGRSVYRLFALSNAASLAALVTFPLLIEPRWDSSTQSVAWSAAYAGFVVACAAAAWLAAYGLRGRRAVSGPQPPDPAAQAASGQTIGLAARLAWLALSALGVLILLGATAHMSQNVASVPFLWLAPLLLYLLSFVLAFEGRGGRGWYRRGWGIPAALSAAVLMSLGLSASSGVLDVALAVPLYCGGVLLTCLFCHGELSARRPAPGQLTSFYLMIALGGALGGLFGGLAAPRIFRSVIEFPLALLALSGAALWVAWRTRGQQRWVLTALAACACVATLYGHLAFVRFLKQDVIWMQRNFYGTLRVRELGEGDHQVRRLLHGVILHGEQPVQSPDRLEPGTYYGRSSGVGLAIAAAQARSGAVRVGVIGLGTGTLAAYGRPGDTLRFYELDPDVVSLARRYFTYLSATPADVQIALGDARLSLQREQAEGRCPSFDVLAVDAFSSDSIPVHLLTRQALELYGRCMAPDGVIAVHISNRFLDLKPVLANLADDLHWSARLVSDDPDDEHTRQTRSDWVLMASRPDVLLQPPLGPRAEALHPDARVGLWTDQFNDLFSIIKSRPVAAFKELFAGLD